MNYIQKQDRTSRNSWHIKKVFSRGGLVIAYCGRRFNPLLLNERDDLPGAKTCESCFRNYSAG